MQKNRQTRLISLALLLSMVLSLIPAGAAAASPWEKTEQPAVVITGTGVVKNQADKASVSNERAYTLDELKAMQQTERLFSTLNNGGYRKQILTKGVDLSALLKLSGYDIAANKALALTVASGSFKRTFESFGATARYRYPNAAAGKEDGKTAVPPVLFFQSAQGQDNGDRVPASSELKSEAFPPVLALGQTSLEDINQANFIKGIDRVTAGASLDGKNNITVLGKTFSRADILLMERVSATYSYITKAGEMTDTVRGVALADLCGSLSAGDTVKITFTDGYSPAEIPVSEIRKAENRYMLATEVKGASGWEAVYNSKNGFEGPYAIYKGASGSVGSGGPLAMIKTIELKAKDLGNSPYKHVTYQGTAQGGVYAIDAITGATLTVEGPGLSATTPILVADLENTANPNIHRGLYTDMRNSSPLTFSYEGVKVLSIIEGLVNENVQKESDDIRIIFKNRWRQDIASISYSELKTAATPVILAYGTGTEDESRALPFVYDDSTGIDKALGNQDGCLKLVYNKDELKGANLPEKFSSVACIYVEPEAGAPGYKHSAATGGIFNAPANTEYLLTFTGSALGREVNYTVKELEDMVEYGSDGKPKPGGLGFRAEYNLSNTTYWYVNSYEGVKLWDLLLKLGLDPKYANDDKTLVWASSWDNYKINYRFSTKQLSDPNLFYYYEKSPVDIGTSRPTKADLAKKEFQPDNQIGVWDKDANGYPVKKGYPVLIAYGVGGYPYVRNSNMEGYAGGLGNDGGPLRVIYGKADNMNRENLASPENYAYFFNNGSNQMQRAEEIYVGDDKRYSTHIENPSYSDMAAQKVLTVEIAQQNGQKETKEYTLKSLETLLYGVEKRDMDNSGRQEKGYYYYKNSGSSKISDLFEGVSLEYLLTEDIGMQGSLGTATIYSGEKSVKVSLSELFEKGGNSVNGGEGLGSMIAFAKNGYPMVGSSSDKGYVDTDKVTGKTIKNSGGPIMFVRAQNASEMASSTIGESIALSNIDKIVVNLEADKYAHTGAYSSYAAQKITFKGAVNNGSVALSVADIEKQQKSMITSLYNIGGTTVRLRGIDLYKLLSGAQVGASALMSNVTITGKSGSSVKLPVADLLNGVGGKRIILAYGSSAPLVAVNDGKALVQDTASAGYDAAFKNSGGPLRLVIEGKDAGVCVENVVSITVSASEITGWTHSSGVYEAYKNQPALRITGSGVKKPVTFTVGQLEAMENDRVFTTYKVGNEIWVQGIDLYKLIANTVGLADPNLLPNFTCYAIDGYSTPFKATDLREGINGKPMIVAYGQGTAQSNGLPLVAGNDQTDIRPGFDPVAGNAFGPVRLIVNDNSGWCVKWLNCIVVGSGSYESPENFPPESLAIPGSGTPNPGGNTSAPTSPGGDYTVVSGDTLWRIAENNLGAGNRWTDIYKINKDRIFNPDRIFPGQILRLP